MVRPLLAGLAILLGAAAPGYSADAPAAAASASASGMPAELLAAVLAADSSTAVYKVSQLPAQVLLLAGLDPETVADANEPYNTTDSVGPGSSGWPFKRLVWGARVGAYYLVGTESGGMTAGAGVSAYRLDGSKSGRFAWSAITMDTAGADRLNRYRTFEAFRDAVRVGGVRGFTGSCVSWLSAPQDALRLMLLPATGQVATQLEQLPAGVRSLVDRRLLNDGRYRLQWAAPVDAGYVLHFVQASGGKGRIAVLRTPVDHADDLLWLGAPGDFADYQAFQDKLRSAMSIEVEQAIMAGQCQRLRSGWSRADGPPILAPIAP